MKAFFCAVFFVFIADLIEAQNYAFYPGDHYTGVLAMEQYSVHQVNIQNLDSEDALMTWRIIENTCPENWEFILCDWPHCYDGMPNTGNMNPVVPGENGLIKLTVNPLDIPGSGYIHFYIFPTGHNDDHVDLFFSFDTEILSMTEKENQEFVIYPQPGNDKVFIRNMPLQKFSIFDGFGRKTEVPV